MVKIYNLHTSPTSGFRMLPYRNGIAKLGGSLHEWGLLERTLLSIIAAADYFLENLIREL